MLPALLPDCLTRELVPCVVERLEEGEMEEGEMEEGEMMTVRVGIQQRHHTHLCLSPPPDPRGDFDPPAGRPPAPTVVLEADLWREKVDS